MNWIQYAILALFAWFLLSRFLPVKGLRNLQPPDVERLLKEKAACTYVDVREAGEYRGGHIKGFANIPLSQLQKRVGEMDPNRPVVLTCQSGMRSRRAAKILFKHGFKDVRHLQTGVSGWSGRLVK